MKWGSFPTDFNPADGVSAIAGQRPQPSDKKAT